jgi:uncharacterized protein YjbJ (UPF0337 family)
MDGRNWNRGRERMNKNQVKGGMKEAAGKVQKEFGKAVDSPKHVVEGGMKELGGKTQKAVGDMQEDADKKEDARKRREAERRI